MPLNYHNYEDEEVSPFDVSSDLKDPRLIVSSSKKYVFTVAVLLHN